MGNTGQRRRIQDGEYWTEEEGSRWGILDRGGGFKVGITGQRRRVQDGEYRTEEEGSRWGILDRGGRFKMGNTGQRRRFKMWHIYHDLL